MSAAFSLDACIPISRATTTNSVCSDDAVVSGCDQPIDIGSPNRPLPAPPTTSVCVNGITNNPWPTPPSADPGCNPLTVQVTNTVDMNADLNRISGEIDYLNGDPCLPRIKLTMLSVPPALFGGGLTGSPRGYGISHQGDCDQIAPGGFADFQTTADYFANRQSAGIFVPSDIDELSDPCLPPCTSSKFFAKLAKFNIIGPVLGVIESATPTFSVNVAGEDIDVAWRYTFSLANCVQSGNTCVSCPSEVTLGPVLNNMLPGGGEVLEGYNIYDNVPSLVDMIKTPGLDLADLKSKGYFPQPLEVGSQELFWGWVPVDQYADAETNPGGPGCSCKVVWFTKSSSDVRGACPSPSGPASLLPDVLYHDGGTY